MSEPIGPKPAIGAGLVFSAAIAINVALFIFGTQPPLSFVLSGAFTGITGFCLVIATGLWIAELKEKKEEKGWCVDCGKKLVVFRAQRGFDQHTGKAHISKELRCPDWATISGNRSDTFCGHRVTTNMSKQCHDPLSYQCPVCIDKMVNDGVLSETEAALLR